MVDHDAAAPRTPPTRRVAYSGANDLRELARAFRRFGITEREFIEAVSAVFVKPTRAERQWLHTVWLEAEQPAAAPLNPKSHPEQP